MSTFLKKIESGGIGSVFILFLAVYVLYILYKYFDEKSNGSIAMETMSKQDNKAYNNNLLQTGGGNISNQGVVPSNPLGQNEVYASVDGIQTSMPGNITNSLKIPNPSDLLPKDGNSEWAQLNPSGSGSLSNINLLKAAWNIGIDTVNSSLRNANQQERSDPVIPYVPTGPWYQSTISPDFMKIPLEISAGNSQ